MPKGHAEFDEIGCWSELKLEIVKDYASAYSKILTAKNLPHVYIDAFAGPGIHISRETGKFVPGSPTNALAVSPPFNKYYLVDLDASRAETLQEFVCNRSDVHIEAGDCNQVLVKKIFPTLGYKTYRRALCLLDPYGLQLDWSVIFQAGQLGTVDMFLNFPVMDMNRNVLWRNPDKVPPKRLERMNAYWGDSSWQNVAYSSQWNLFGEREKESNEAVVEGFRQRLIQVAGFKRVPEPLPMRNKKNAVVYYLFFASQVEVADKIVRDIFKKYR